MLDIVKRRTPDKLDLMKIILPTCKRNLAFHSSNLLLFFPLFGQKPPYSSVINVLAAKIFRNAI